MVQSRQNDPFILAQHVLKDTHTLWLVSCLRAVCSYKIPELLSREDDMSIQDLALQTGTQAPLLKNVLRYLTTFGYFECINPLENQENQRFRNTPLSLCLQDWSSYVLNHLGERMMQEWLCLEKLLASGVNAPFQLFGMPLYRYFDEHPDESVLFDSSLQIVGQPLQEAIIAALPVTGNETIIDIGGGNGALLTTIKLRFPTISCLLYERPAVIEPARQRLEQAGITLISGDFFANEIPSGDILLLGHVLHNYPDDMCMKLLRKCRSACQKCLLIFEFIQPDGQIDQFAEGLSLLMKLEQEGYERTERQFQVLLQQTGFALTKIDFLAKNRGLMTTLPLTVAPL